MKKLFIFITLLTFITVFSRTNVYACTYSPEFCLDDPGDTGGGSTSTYNLVDTGFTISLIERNGDYYDTYDVYIDVNDRVTDLYNEVFYLKHPNYNSFYTTENTDEYCWGCGIWSNGTIRPASGSVSDLLQMNNITDVDVKNQDDYMIMEPMTGGIIEFPNGSKTSGYYGFLSVNSNEFIVQQYSCFNSSVGKYVIGREISPGIFYDSNIVAAWNMSGYIYVETEYSSTSSLPYKSGHFSDILYIFT